MNKTKNIIWIITVAALVFLSVILYKTISAKNENQSSVPQQIFDVDPSFQSGEFWDGLNNPDSVITYKLKDYEPGISEKYIYSVDINQDGKNDRITKTFFENWNAHSYYKYTIELNDNGKYIDVTPKNLQTTNGADCDLQQIQFKFKPHFQIIIISREMGEFWDDETMAYKQTYSLHKNELKPSDKKPIRKVCDVKELF